MEGMDRRKILEEVLSKGRLQFNHFVFDDDSLLNDEDVQIIGQIGFPDTEAIRYQGNELTAVSVKILCEAYPNAEEIELSNNPINDEATQYIAKLTELRRLRLRNTHLTAIGLKSFVGVEMKCLIEVHLNNSNLGQKGCQLLTSAVWPYLKGIYLTGCGVDDRGAFHLSKANWRGFQWLYMMNNFITRRGVDALRKAHWRELKTFNIQSDTYYYKFKMEEFYPHAFDPNCNFSFRRVEPLRFMMRVSSRLTGYVVPFV